MRVGFPLGGIHAQLGFQSREPFFSSYVNNCYPIDPLAQLLRGGARYGISRALSTRPTSNPVIGLIAFRNGAATSVNLLAITGLTSGNPVAHKYASGSWTAVTMTATLPATGGKRIVLMPYTDNGDISIMCESFGTNIYYFDESANEVKLQASASASSGMRHNAQDWVVWGPREWGNGVTSGTLEVSGLQTSNDKVTGCISWAPRLALFFGQQWTMALTGELPGGGQFVTVSQRFGMLDPLSWCRAPGNVLYVMCRAGLLRFNAPGFAEPELVNYDRTPSSIIGIDPAAYHVTLQYDTLLRGVHIFVTPIATGAAAYWFYKTPEKDNPGGYWPGDIVSDVAPLCAMSYADPPSGITASSYTDVLLGVRTGYIEQFNPSVATDDGNAVTSTCWFGPFYGDSPERRGKVAAVRITLAAGSGSVTFTTHPGESAEEAFAASAHSTYTMTAGTNYVWRPNMRAYAFFIKATSTSRWALENCTVERHGAGGVY